ncbi:GTPase-activating Rap/Ran-GAP domain-like protein 3 [Balamuthia mandrillaris]
MDKKDSDTEDEGYLSAGPSSPSGQLSKSSILRRERRLSSDKAATLRPNRRRASTTHNSGSDKIERGERGEKTSLQLPSSSPTSSTSGMSLISPRGGAADKRGYSSSNKEDDRKKRPVCAYCKKEIRKERLEAMNKTFHPEHFKCGGCKKRLTDYFVLEDKAYCRDCHNERTCDKCAHCDKPITKDKIVALGKYWHAEHFFCCVCKCTFNPNTPFCEKDGKAYCEKDFNNAFMPRCAKCDQVISDGSCVSAMGKNWHPNHFCCVVCEKPIDVGEPVYVHKGQPYCPRDFKLQSKKSGPGGGTSFPDDIITANRDAPPLPLGLSSSLPSSGSTTSFHLPALSGLHNNINNSDKEGGTSPSSGADKKKSPPSSGPNSARPSHRHNAQPLSMMGAAGSSGGGVGGNSHTPSLASNASKMKRSRSFNKHHTTRIRRADKISASTADIPSGQGARQKRSNSDTPEGDQASEEGNEAGALPSVASSDVAVGGGGDGSGGEGKQEDPASRAGRRLSMLLGDSWKKVSKGTSKISLTELQGSPDENYNAEDSEGNVVGAMMTMNTPTNADSNSGSSTPTMEQRAASAVTLDGVSSDDERSTSSASTTKKRSGKITFKSLSTRKLKNKLINIGSSASLNSSNNSSNNKDSLADMSSSSSSDDESDEDEAWSEWDNSQDFMRAKWAETKITEGDPVLIADVLGYMREFGGEHSNEEILIPKGPSLVLPFKDYFHEAGLELDHWVSYDDPNRPIIITIESKGKRRPGKRKKAWMYRAIVRTVKGDQRFLLKVASDSKRAKLQALRQADPQLMDVKFVEVKETTSSSQNYNNNNNSNGGSNSNAGGGGNSGGGGGTSGSSGGGTSSVASGWKAWGTSLANSFAGTSFMGGGSSSSSSSNSNNSGGGVSHSSSSTGSLPTGDGSFDSEGGLYGMEDGGGSSKQGGRGFRFNGRTLSEDLVLYERRMFTNHYKFGVLYAKHGQTTENEMYTNEKGSEAFEEFLEVIGERITLKGWNRFRAGLNVTDNLTGTHSIYTDYNGFEVMFHVSTYIPFTTADAQQVERKRHLGNDVVLVVFRDSDNNEPFNPEVIKSQFNHVFCVVQPEGDRYRVAFACKQGVRPNEPYLPYPPLFSKGKDFREFLLAKLINAEQRAMNAQQFCFALRRTRKELLREIVQKYISP